MLTGDVKQKLTAIFSADVEGYGRLKGEDELATVKTLPLHKETMGMVPRQYRGRIGDSTIYGLLKRLLVLMGKGVVSCAGEYFQK